ncbi:MAG TPA: glycosyltransferase family 39 protein [Chloroflexota bacterium]
MFLVALLLRLGFGLLTSSTFDPDEFVILALGKAVSHGAAAYGSITYFHPPGMLVLFAWLSPLLSWWWPLGRVVIILFDSGTAFLVWRVARELRSEKEALVAGLLYAFSPIALVSAVRIGPDPVITFFGIGGLFLLLASRSRAATVGAGVCLAIAVWTKYPAVFFVPAYLLLARRRSPLLLLSCAAALVCLLVPFSGQTRAMLAQTVQWQLGHRSASDLAHRLGPVGVYWLLLNPLAVAALWKVRQPLWIVLGFSVGAAFLLTSQAYYHYFVPMVPFAALLAAPLATSLLKRCPTFIGLVALGASCLWGIDIAHGTPMMRLFVTASSFADAQQTAVLLDHSTNSRAPVLTDEYEYAMFAHRKTVNYFWNMNTMVRARSLERHIPRLSAVVETRGDPTYPPGFIDYLQDKRFPHFRTRATDVWLMHPLHNGRVALAVHNARASGPPASTNAGARSSVP